MRARALVAVKNYALAAVIASAMVAGLSFAVHLTGVGHEGKALCHTHGAMTHCHVH